VFTDAIGTNTYLVGRRNPYILVDTGEGRDHYITVLELALRETAVISNPELPDISEIIVTHKHADHYKGIRGVLTLIRKRWSERNPSSTERFRPPRLWKFPLKTQDLALNNYIKTVPVEDYIQSPSGTPWHDLSDNLKLPVTVNESDTPDPDLASIHFLFTPGHTADSVAIYFPLDKALFTADTVLGYGSTIFEDLGTYMVSLQKMYDYNEALTEGKPKYIQLYPGHGPVVKDGPKNIEIYIAHRNKRDKQIIEVLSTPPPGDEPWTTWTIVGQIYKGYPQNLWDDAAHSLDSHLRKLEKEGRVEALGGVGKDVMWELL
jgi:ribonuclease/clavin/mitogillin